MGSEGQAPKDHWYRSYAVPQDRLETLQERLQVCGFHVAFPEQAITCTIGRTPLLPSAPRRQRPRHKRHSPIILGDFSCVAYVYVMSPVYFPFRARLYHFPPSLKIHELCPYACFETPGLRGSRSGCYASGPKNASGSLSVILLYDFLIFLMQFLTHDRGALRIDVHCRFCVLTERVLLVF